MYQHYFFLLHLQYNFNTHSAIYRVHFNKIAILMLTEIIVIKCVKISLALWIIARTCWEFCGNMMSRCQWILRLEVHNFLVRYLFTNNSNIHITSFMHCLISLLTATQDVALQTKIACNRTKWTFDQPHKLARRTYFSCK